MKLNKQQIDAIVSKITSNINKQNEKIEEELLNSKKYKNSKLKEYVNKLNDVENTITQLTEVRNSIEEEAKAHLSMYGIYKGYYSIDDKNIQLKYASKVTNTKYPKEVNRQELYNEVILATLENESIDELIQKITNKFI